MYVQLYAHVYTRIGLHVHKQPTYILMYLCTLYMIYICMHVLMYAHEAVYLHYVPMFLCIYVSMVFNLDRFCTFSCMCNVFGMYVSTYEHMNV